MISPINKTSLILKLFPISISRTTFICSSLKRYLPFLVFYLYSLESSLCSVVLSYFILLGQMRLIPVIFSLRVNGHIGKCLFLFQFKVIGIINWHRYITQSYSDSAIFQPFSGYGPIGKEAKKVSGKCRLHVLPQKQPQDTKVEISDQNHLRAYRMQFTFLSIF